MQGYFIIMPAIESIVNFVIDERLSKLGTGE